MKYLYLTLLITTQAYCLPADVEKEVRHYVANNGHKKPIKTVIESHDGVKNQIIQIHMSQINHKALKDLQRYKEVHVNMGGKVNDEHLMLLGGLENIHCLDLAGCKINKEHFNQLAPHTKLHTLNLSWTDITDDDLRKLTIFKNLTSLDLVWTNITDKGLSELIKELPNLRSLNLSKTGISDGLIRQLTTNGVRVVRV